MASVSEMINQSRDVLTKPSVATFERYESQGSLVDAMVYVAIAAGITGIFGLSDGISGFMSGVLVTVLGFLVFTYLVYYIGKQQGGSGSLDEVAYTFSLFWAPLAVIFGILTFVLLITIIGILLIPVVGILAIVVNIYFAYLAVQSSMNLPPSGKVWMVLLLAAVGSFVVNIIIGAILT